MWEIFKDDNDYNEKSIIGFGAFTIMVIFILGASADIDPSGKLGSWLNACMLLSASISPAVFGWILLDQSLSEIYPYLMFFLLAAFICIFITKRELEPVDKV